MANPTIHQDHLGSIRWYGKNFGAVANEILKNGALKAIDPLENEVKSTKNILRAFVVTHSTEGIHAAQWDNIYISGWNSFRSKNGQRYRTAGDVMLGRSSREIANKEFFDRVKQKDLSDAWGKANSQPVITSFQGFCRKHCHTEQTFLTDVFLNEKQPVFYGEAKPKFPQRSITKVLLYLFSTRQPCKNCQMALEGLSQNKPLLKVFLYKIFGNTYDKSVQLKVIVSHIRGFPQVILANGDLIHVKNSVIDVAMFKVTPSQAVRSLPAKQQEGRIKLKASDQSKDSSSSDDDDDDDDDDEDDEDDDDDDNDADDNEEGGEEEIHQPLQESQIPFSGFKMPANFFRPPKITQV